MNQTQVNILTNVFQGCWTSSEALDHIWTRRSSNNNVLLSVRVTKSTCPHVHWDWFAPTSSLHNVRYFHDKAKRALHEQKLLNGNKINTDNSLSLKFIWFLKFLMDWNGCTLLYLIPAGFIAPHRFKFQSKLSYLAIYFLNDGRNLVQATSSRSVNWRVLVNTWTKTSLRLFAFLKLPSSNSSQLRTSSCQHS